MPPSPAIYRLAANRDYESIPSRVQSHPKDLYWTDRYGSTALHILCQARHVASPPSLLLDAVNSMVEVAPEIVGWPNVATWTPLHFAVEQRLEIEGGDEEDDRNASTAVILRLIQACPQAVSVPTKRGYKTKTPFHIACEANADHQVLKRMLEIDPSLATKNFARADPYAAIENPLQLLWKHHDQSRTEQKMELLLRAAQRQLGDDENDPTSQSLLAAACSVRCPRDYFNKVIQNVLKEEPSAKYLQHGPSGNLPLHFAVSRPDMQQQTRPYTQFVVEQLIQAFQNQQCANKRGQWPLHLALSRHLTWHNGVKQIVEDAPNVLRVPDPDSHLVPFLASATAASQTRLHLSTTFELLLAAPEMIQCLRMRTRNAGPVTSKMGSDLGVFQLID